MNLPHEPAARCGVLDACDRARTAPTRTHQSDRFSPQPLAPPFETFKQECILQANGLRKGRG